MDFTFNNESSLKKRKNSQELSDKTEKKQLPSESAQLQQILLNGESMVQIDLLGVQVVVSRGKSSQKSQLTMQMKLKQLISKPKAFEFYQDQIQGFLDSGYKFENNTENLKILKFNTSNIKLLKQGKFPTQTSEIRDTQQGTSQKSEKSGKYQSLTDLTDNAVGDFSPMNSEFSSILGKPTSGGISVLLAKPWDELNDPTGYIMSEKLDGVRCFWNGKELYSRNKLRFYAPPFFTKNWPKAQLDGELWIGRNTFQKCVSVVRKQNPIEEEWKNVYYVVYDAPGLAKPFKDRIKALQQVLPKLNNPHIKCHPHIECKSREHLIEELDNVLKKEGEGLMLRDPKAQYENKRSETLLKVKVFHDAEARIIGYEKGQGSITGMIGALVVENSDGVRFKIGGGFNYEQRSNPPKIGTVVTYKYQNLTNEGKPRFPIFLRVYQGI